MTVPLSSKLSPPTGTVWTLSDRFDPRAVVLADRHYSRQKPGTHQFVKPGSCLVLITGDINALWVTSWQKREYVDHDWPGAWECALFRNEGPRLSSNLIREAVAITRWRYGDPPAEGFITFVDPDKTRRKRDPGRCFRKAGWKAIGETAGGKIVFHLAAENVGEPAPPEGHGTQLEMAA